MDFDINLSLSLYKLDKKCIIIKFYTCRNYFMYIGIKIVQS